AIGATSRTKLKRGTAARALPRRARREYEGALTRVAARAVVARTRARRADDVHNRVRIGRILGVARVVELVAVGDPEVDIAIDLAAPRCRCRACRAGEPDEQTGTPDDLHGVLLGRAWPIPLQSRDRATEDEFARVEGTEVAVSRRTCLSDCLAVFSQSRRPW